MFNFIKKQSSKSVKKSRAPSEKTSRVFWNRSRSKWRVCSASRPLPRPARSCRTIRRAICAWYSIRTINVCDVWVSWANRLLSRVLKQIIPNTKYQKLWFIQPLPYLLALTNRRIRQNRTWASIEFGVAGGQNGAATSRRHISAIASTSL